MDLPKIDLNELKKIKIEIQKERVYSHKKYVEWLKKTPNKEGSSQRKLMESKSS